MTERFEDLYKKVVLRLEMGGFPILNHRFMSHVPNPTKERNGWSEDEADQIIINIVELIEEECQTP